jgi:alpha-tubulin suppressor-like RCC1 family protein
VSVAAGSDHSCAVDESGAASCWGLDTDGQASPPSASFVAVSAGVFHSCGLTVNGAVRCWGSDNFGQVSVP